MKKYTFLIIMMVLSLTLSAEIIPSAFTPAMLSPSISMPSYMTMNHSVSFMSGISSNNESYYQSVYTNHLKFNLNSKLDLKLDLNFVNFGSATFDSWQFDSNDDNQSKVLPNFQLNYQPSENMKIQIEFNNYHAPQYFNRNWRY